MDKFSCDRLGYDNFPYLKRFDSYLTHPQLEVELTKSRRDMKKSAPIYVVHPFHMLLRNVLSDNVLANDSNLIRTITMECTICLGALIQISRSFLGAVPL